MLIRYFKILFLEPKRLFVFLLNRLGRIFPDKLYIQINFFLSLGYKINLRNPKTFNEKLNWLKLNHRCELYTLLADKFLVKQYVKEKIGEQYVVPLLGVWNNIDDINLDDLPSQFVLKATHDSSGAVICYSKDDFDYSNVKKHFCNVLKRNYFYSCREWPYKNIKPRIISEVLLKSGDLNKPIQDYKFMCFNGVPKLMYCTIKGGEVYENFYDMEFNPIYISHDFPRHLPEFEKPASFQLMKSLAEKLAQNIPFVRIDFYEVEGNVYFGEYTFYDWAGFKPYNNIEWDYKLGEWIDLSGLNE